MIILLQQQLNKTKQRTVTDFQQKQNGNMQPAAETHQKLTGIIHIVMLTKQKELYTVIQRMPDWTV